MPNVISLLVGQLQSNCYLVSFHRDKSRLVPTIIIDPGDDTDLIIQTLQDKCLKPVAIIATHGHFDHIMAAYELQKVYNIPFYIHKKDKFLLERLLETASHFLGGKVVVLPPEEISYINNKSITFLLSNKAKLTRIEVEPKRGVLTSSKIKIISVPGHTPGSIAIYFPRGSYRPSTSSGLQDDGSEGMVFVGDLIFAGGGYGRTDFSYSFSLDLQSSIQTILKLPANTIIYSGHGEPTSVEAEKRFY